MREPEEKVPKSRLLYKTEEAWLNAQESKRRYCRRYHEQHRKELYEKNRRRKAAKAAVARRKRQRIKNRFDAVNEEFGKVVIRLNFELLMSQTAIFDLLGGLISSQDIAKICKREQQRLHRLREAKAKRNAKRH